MVRRRPHETIELDQSLRQSRAIWLTLAIAATPIALGGLTWVYFGVATLLGEFDDSIERAAIEMLIGLVVIASDIFLFMRTAECSRRLKILHEDPTVDVKPMPAPFQSSLLGPYH